MGLATYADLLMAIASWHGRPADATITDNDDDFVTLAEMRIYSGYGDPGDPFYSPAVRTRLLETSADLTISVQTAAMPSDFLAPRRLYLNVNPVRQLDYLAPTDFWSRFMTSESGEPVAYTIEGSNFVFGPSPATTYTGKLLYWKKFAALSSGVNALFTAAPNLWLWASCFEAAVFLDDPEAMSKFHSLYMVAAKGVNATDRTARYGGAPLMIRTDTSNPPQVA